MRECIVIVYAVDAVAGLLDGPRARGAFLLRLSFGPPWALRIQDEAPLAVLSAVRGSSLIIPDEGEPVRLEAGDVAIARGPAPYTIADDPATPIQAIVHPGQACTTPQGEELKLMQYLGTRTWGNAPDGGTVLMTGVYESAGEISARLLRALPPLLAVDAARSTRRSSRCWRTRSSRTRRARRRCSTGCSTCC